MKFETMAIHSSGNTPKPGPGVSPPIQLSTTFERNDDGSFPDGLIYSRMDTPNRRELETRLATLEGGEKAFCFSSGMAAISALLGTLKPNDHLLLPDDVFFATRKLAHTVLRPLGVEVSSVNMLDLQEVEHSIRPNTSVVWLESPTNPLLNVCDIEAIANLAHKQQAICAVDNTWPTSALQRPIELGADVVMHSTTKYIGGHSDVTGGCLILAKEDELALSLQNIRTLTGGVPSAFDCWLLSRGLKTLHLRITRQSESAKQLAGFLASHSRIERVHYPGLESHAGHPVACRQMSGGFGGMLSVQLHGDAAFAKHVARRLDLFTNATSLGGVESLIEHRKSVEDSESKTPANLLRISVGLEHVEDLIEDWEKVLR